MTTIWTNYSLLTQLIYTFIHIPGIKIVLDMISFSIKSSYENSTHHYMTHLWYLHVTVSMLYGKAIHNRLFICSISNKHPTTLQYRIYHEKPTATHTVKKVPTFYTTRRFATTFARTHYWSLSWTRRIQPTPHFSITHLNFIISPMLNSPKLFQFSDWNFVCISYPSHDMVHALLLHRHQFYQKKKKLWP